MKKKRDTTKLRKGLRKLTSSTKEYHERLKYYGLKPRKLTEFKRGGRVGRRQNPWKEDFGDLESARPWFKEHYNTEIRRGKTKREALRSLQLAKNKGFARRRQFKKGGRVGGWSGDRKRHSLAAKKGWRNRR